MIRKTVSLLLLICFVGSMGLYAADSVDALSYEQRQAYFRDALSIQTVDRTEISGGIYDYGYWGGYASTWAESNTTTDWYPYEGAFQISKVDFYELTGQYDLAAAEAKAEKLNNSMAIAGWSVLGAGLLTMLSSLFFIDDPNATDWWLLGIGSVISCVSVPLLCIQVSNDVSISFAVGLADNYNKRLLESF